MDLVASENKRNHKASHEQAETCQLYRKTLIHWPYVKRLYKAVVIPRILYAGSIWCQAIYTRSRTREESQSQPVGFGIKLEPIQRAAALATTSAMRWTPTKLLNVHADLLAAQLLLKPP